MILVFADANSPLIENRISFLKKLNKNVLLVHNATGIPLSPDKINSYKNLGFEIKEQAKIKNRELRYLISALYTFFLLLRYRPEVVVVHWASRIYQVLPLSLFGGKVILTVMGGEIMQDQEASNKKKNFFTKILIKKARFVTTESEFMKSIVRSDYGRCSDVFVNNFGVNKAFFSKKRDENFMKSLGLPLDKNIFMSIRGFHPFYRAKEIFTSFIEFKKITSSDSILVASKLHFDESYYEEILELVENSGFKEDIYIFESFKNSEMSSYLSMADFVISLSPSDGLPHSMLECLAMGKFVIYRDLEQYYGYLEHLKNAYLLKNDNNLVEALQFCDLNKPSSHSRKETLDSIDEDRLQKSYIELVKKICKEI